MSTAKPRKRMSASERRTVIETAATEVFAAHGYRRASMEEIASRSGVSVPVVYDHFSSKRDLHRRLLERHYADLRDLWRDQLDVPDPAGDPVVGEDIARAFDAWFRYIETHPYAWRMLFSDTTGDPDVRAVHATVVTDSRDALLPFFARLVGIPYAPEPEGEEAREGGGGDQMSRVEAELAWEVCRNALQGLAMWWLGRPEVPRERLVAAAMDALWTGLDRSRRGEHWPVGVV